MQDAISPVTRSSRRLVATSLVLFAGAGIANTSPSASSSSGSTVVAVAGVVLAVGGVYALGLYARRADRKALAANALALWTAFLCVAVVELAAIDVGHAGPIADVLAAAWGGVSWATLLGACASTAFLCFREYGTDSPVGAYDDAALENDFDL